MTIGDFDHRQASPDSGSSGSFPCTLLQERLWAQLRTDGPAGLNIAMRWLVNTRRMARPSNYWAQLPKVQHIDLADALFARSRRTMFRTNAERHAVNAAIQAFEVAFFKSALVDEHAPLLGLIGRNDQTVRWISPTSPPGTASAKQ